MNNFWTWLHGFVTPVSIICRCKCSIPGKKKLLNDRLRDKMQGGTFLVADTPLYTLPCWSVRPSVHPSIRPSVSFFCILPNHSRLWCRVSGLVYNTVTARFNAPNSIENISHIDNNKEFASNGLICLSPDILTWPGLTWPDLTWYPDTNDCGVQLCTILDEWYWYHFHGTKKSQKKL